MPWVGRGSLGEVGDQVDQQIGRELAASTKQSYALNGGRWDFLIKRVRFSQSGTVYDILAGSLHIWNKVHVCPRHQ